MNLRGFDTVADYLDAQTAEGDLAGIPVPLVAEHLNVTPAAITAMLNTGRLEGIRIVRATLVTAASLQARQSKLLGEVAIVRKFLLKQAKQGVRAVFYEPIMAQIGLSPRVPADRTHIGNILAKVSMRSHAEDGVLLSVLVHKKKAGITRPGQGFFTLARELGFSWNDDDKFVRQQTDKALNIYG